MREKFEDHTFSEARLKMLRRIQSVLDRYGAQGYRLSLRQLYYQLVSRGWVENNTRSYKRIGSLVSEGRLAGVIDWAMIEDRQRDLQLPAHYKNPGEVLKVAASGYRINRWVGQAYHVEVMVEKDALSGVLAPVCARWDVGFTANRGYSSSSAMYEAGKRMARKAAAGKKLVVLYLGDHDPSGIDMSRDVKARLELFAGSRVRVRRIALNMEQVEQYKPPPNPAKMDDSRARAYVEQFGEMSWELDALEPTVLVELVVGNIRANMDDAKYDARVKKETEERALLTTLARDWTKARALLQKETEHGDREDGAAGAGGA